MNIDEALFFLLITLILSNSFKNYYRASLAGALSWIQYAEVDSTTEKA